jgi:HKD family nuclease
MEQPTQNSKAINDLVEEYFQIAKDDNITTVELNKLTKDVMNDHFSLDDTKKLLNALFLKSADTFTDENDKKKIHCLKKVVSHLVDNFFDKKGGVSDALFFPSEESEKSLIKYLNMAKHTIEICVFTISNDKLARTIEGLHNRGVKVRLITDDECAKNKGADIYELADRGIPVRTDNNLQAHMHNKYVVIDDKILITGSFNWTWQAVKSNQENLLIVEKEDLVKRYKEAFEKLWTQFAKNTV